MSTQRCGLKPAFAGHGALYRQELLASTPTEGDAANVRRGLQ
jgi:hypothetical protein